MSELRASDLSVTYGEVVAVRPLHLTVPAGRMLAVTGPSGAGKSSLLWALARAIRPAAASVTGTVSIDGIDIDASRSGLLRDRIIFGAGRLRGARPTDEG